MVVLLISYVAFIVCVKKIANSGNIGIFRADSGCRARLVCTKVEYVAYLFWAYHQVDIAIRLVYHHFFGISLRHVVAKGGIVYLLVNASSRTLSALRVHHIEQTAYDEEIEPRQIKSWHFSARLIATWHHIVRLSHIIVLRNIFGLG